MDINKMLSDNMRKHTNDELYQKQLEMLDTFLEHKAISQAQYDKSVEYLTENMEHSNP